MHHSHPDGTPYPAAKCPLLYAVSDGDGVRLSGEVFWRKDGSGFPVECSGYPIRDGEIVIGGVITFHDVSERRMAEHQLAAQYQTARVLAEAQSLDDALPRVLELSCEQLGWQMCVAWAPGEDGGLHCRSAYAPEGWEEQLALLSHETVTRGRGAVWQAWERGQPVFVPGPGLPVRPPRAGNGRAPGNGQAAGNATIIEARDGEEAFHLAADQSPDMAVLDVMMPRLNGFDLTERLRLTPATQRLPILLMSASVQEADISRGFAAGADGYLTKPFTPDQLLTRVRDVLSRG
jgi:CheY-like chemotaxis protein